MRRLEIQLRPYQEEAIDAFFAALPKHRRQLITLPTGAGKTVVFGTLAKRYYDTVSSGKPILVMAHRTELLEQAEAKLRMVWPDVLTGRVQAERNEQLAQVILASTQTLVAGRSIREPGLIIYDECHHSRAEGALRVLEQFVIKKNKVSNQRIKSVTRE
ncbi:DEAD/DEAH box helicase family protein [Alicyclobacillus tolerans]|uniref:DEAD/DEAH box helicase family protein n=1 Tax=Alicyclobacillus tolerans TaxID=90970 RepID=UPI001F4223D1|nr:DEAD/DEAH box helicase family protein [Alicyclobacillus tolerans]MCF8568329.1 DEAD/DEAH box helicase family protein [Alicyclobacillus tolerans]